MLYSTEYLIHTSLLELIYTHILHLHLAWPTGIAIWSDRLCQLRSRPRGIPGFGGHFLVDPPNLVGFSLFRGRCVCHFFWWTFFGGRLVSHFFWWTHFGGPLVWYFISWTLNQSCAPMVNFHVPESSIDWADVS